MKQFLTLLCLTMMGHWAFAQTGPTLPKRYKIPQPDILKLDTTRAAENRKYWEDRIRYQLNQRGSLKFARLSHKIRQGSVFMLAQDQMPCLSADTEDLKAMPNGWRPNRYTEKPSLPNSLD